jgi:hypothetical protein
LINRNSSSKHWVLTLLAGVLFINVAFFLCRSYEASDGFSLITETGRYGPDKNGYVITVSTGAKRGFVGIFLDIAGATASYQVNPISDYHNWMISWDEGKSRLWIYSGDTGFRIYEFMLTDGVLKARDVVPYDIRNEIPSQLRAALSANQARALNKRPHTGE